MHLQKTINHVQRKPPSDERYQAIVLVPGYKTETNTIAAKP